MSSVADHYDHVVGVDTHARTHTYVVLEAGTDAAQVRELIVQDRIAGLRERAARFVQEVAATL